MTKRETIRKLTLAGEDRASIATALGLTRKNVEVHVYQLRRDGLLPPPSPKPIYTTARSDPDVAAVWDEAARKRGLDRSELLSRIMLTVASDKGPDNFIAGILSEV